MLTKIEKNYDNIKWGDGTVANKKWNMNIINIHK